MQRGAATPALFDVTLPGGVTLTGVISPLRDPDSAVPNQGWVIILRDVSHIKAAEESRIEFVQTAAHDLRRRECGLEAVQGCLQEQPVLRQGGG